MVHPTCDGWCQDVDAPLTYLDPKGYVYCSPCGLLRKQSQQCRRLTKTEIRLIMAGHQLARY